MRKHELVDDALWTRLQPLLPVFQPSPLGGPKRRISDRQALNGILFVLRAGIAWDELPLSLGYGTGMTCWRRLQIWKNAGVWPKVELLLEVEFRFRQQIDFDRSFQELPPRRRTRRRPRLD